MKRKYLIIPALCLTVAFGCDSDRRTAHSDGYVETDGLNEAEYAEGLDDAETGEELGGEGSFEVETERTSAEGVTEDVQLSLSRAASTNMLEMKLANLAEEKALSPQVTEFAQMLGKDHEMANEKLRTIAEMLNFTLPQTVLEDQEGDVIEDLREYADDDFDKEFMSRQVDMHEKNIEEFQAMAEETNEPQVQEWAENYLSMLREHKDQAQQLLDQLENENRPNRVKAL